MRVITGAGFFAYFALGGAAMSWVVLPWVTRGARDAGTMRRARSLCARGFEWFHAGLRAFDFVDFDPGATELSGVPSPCVIVANHPTLIDTPAIGATIPDLCFVVKRDLYGSPLFGPLMRACGHIDAGEGGTLAAASVVREALERLAEGCSVLMFPEGTRSPLGGLRRLRRGAFEIACRASVPVVPLWIECDPPVVTSSRPWYALPPRAAHYTVTALPPLDPRDFDGDARRLARHVEELYRSRIRG